MATTSMTKAAHTRRGFTLIELLVAVLITAILVSMVVPAYLERQVRVHRTAALQALQSARHCETSQRVQGFAPASQRCIPPPNPHYQFLLVATEGAHEWRAQPRARQMSDACGTLALDHLGAKRVLGAVRSSQACWQGR